MQSRPSMTATEIDCYDAKLFATNDGQYTIDRRIGKGAFGTVFLATDNKNSGHQVAIKIIRANANLVDIALGKEPRRVKEGHQEALKLFRLRHKNIVKIVNTYKIQPTRVWITWTLGVAIVTEYYANGNLEEYLKSLTQQPSVLERLDWYRQLATGLAFIHGNNIAHRDLKLANIFVHSNNMLKIGDVGLAKVIWDEQSGSGEHQDMTFQKYLSSCDGTPPYMAPEVWRGRYGITCDVFSIGLVYAMIAEVPNPLTPKVRYQNNEYKNGLGWLLYKEEPSRSMKATELLITTFCNSRKDEKALFNKMLCYDTNSRPSISEVENEIIKIRTKYTAERTPSSLYWPQQPRTHRPRRAKGTLAKIWAKRFWLIVFVAAFVVIFATLFYL